MVKDIRVSKLNVVTLWITASAIGCQPGSAPRSSLRFEISFPDSVQHEPMDGRVVLAFATDDQREPRFVAASYRGGPPFYGTDIDGLKPGQPAVIDASTLGYPIASLADLPKGQYFVQAVLNVYTTFHRADGHVVKLHMDRWEGQDWKRSPGNLVSDVKRVDLDPAAGGTFRLSLTRRLPPIDPPRDTRYVKHIKMKSDVVSKFWGADMYIGAAVLLPEGFESHPRARYPVAYYQDHFSPTMVGFREQPPDPNATGNDSAFQAMSFNFYREWTSGKMPRMIVVMPQDPNPIYDDAYGVNTANIGPYGDAFTQELLPRIERDYRAIGEGWARTVFGGSTGGWRSLALQVFYPDQFNGTWTFCPDPVDFHKFQLINIYEDDNAYYPNSQWKKTPVRPLMRGVDDQIYVTQKEASTMELVLGTRGRSGQQLDAFQAVFGPVGSDGYPRLLWDKNTGAIDKGVIDYWRDHYDLNHSLQKNWAALGPKLRGKIHIAIGDMDTFFLDEAALLLQQFLEGTKNPNYAGSFDWGKRQPHCYSGAPPNQHFFSFYLPQMARHITQTAPAGADLSSWRY